MSKQIRIEKVDFITANERCKCGHCSHQLMRVVFDNGKIWYPTAKELEAVKQIQTAVLKFNLANDKHCFKKEQEVDLLEVVDIRDNEEAI